MARQPTGRPPGRPRTLLVEKLGIKDAVTQLKDTTVDRAHRVWGNLCPDCFPDGWPQGYRTMGCPHGIWVKR